MEGIAKGSGGNVFVIGIGLLSREMVMNVILHWPAKAFKVNYACIFLVITGNRMTNTEPPDYKNIQEGLGPRMAEMYQQTLCLVGTGRRNSFASN